MAMIPSMGFIIMVIMNLWMTFHYLPILPMGLLKGVTIHPRKMRHQDPAYLLKLNATRNQVGVQEKPMEPLPTQKLILWTGLPQIT